MNDVEVILVGDELLKGERTDAHLAYMGRTLLARGLRIGLAHVVGDDHATIATLLSERLANSRAVLMSGGLGPTDDDLTRPAVAAALGVELEFHDDLWDEIRNFFESRGRKAVDSNRQQAEIPAGATVMRNPLGTAPGFWSKHGGSTVFVLPGPPRELQPMLEASVLPRLDEIFGCEALRVETFRTTGIGESQLMELVGEHLRAVQSCHVSSLPGMTGVDVVLTEKSAGTGANVGTEAEDFDRVLREAIGTKYYERGDRSLAAVLGAELIRLERTLSIAESLSGGWIGKLLTDVPGSSAYFLADAVTYSNESKTPLVGVRTDTLETHGAVSEEVCSEMAHGVRQRTQATYGIATTGVAGPDGGTAKKPVGLVFIGLVWEGGAQVRRMVIPASRDDIRRRVACHALWMLFDQLQK